MIYDVDVVDVQLMDAPLHNKYGMLLRYSAKFFTGLLLPKHVLYHQKFVLAINNLFFVRHPVCVDDDVSSSTKFNLPITQGGNGLSPALPPPLPLLPPPCCHHCGCRHSTSRLSMRCLTCYPRPQGTLADTSTSSTSRLPSCSRWCSSRSKSCRTLSRRNAMS